MADRYIQYDKEQNFSQNPKVYIEQKFLKKISPGSPPSQSRQRHIKPGTSNNPPKTWFQSAWLCQVILIYPGPNSFDKDNHLKNIYCRFIKDNVHISLGQTDNQTGLISYKTRTKDIKLNILNWSAPGQNGCHSPDDIFRCIFVNKKFCILSKISMRFVPKGPIDNKPVLV